MTIAKKHAASYMPNGEVSLEQVIQAAIDEATEIRKQEVALILTGARKRIRELEAERVPDGWKLKREGRWISIIQPDGKGVKVRLNLEGYQDAAATLYRLADALLAAAPAKEGE